MPLKTKEEFQELRCQIDLLKPFAPNRGIEALQIKIKASIEALDLLQTAHTSKKYNNPDIKQCIEDLINSQFVILMSMIKGLKNHQLKGSLDGTSEAVDAVDHITTGINQYLLNKHPAEEFILAKQLLEVAHSKFESRPKSNEIDPPENSLLYCLGMFLLYLAAPAMIAMFIWLLPVASPIIVAAAPAIRPLIIFAYYVCCAICCAIPGGVLCGISYSAQIAEDKTNKLTFFGEITNVENEIASFKSASL